MEKLDYEVRCPRCGHIIKGGRRKNEPKKDFECGKCTGRFSLTFNYPDREEMERRFLNDEIPAGPAVRLYGAIKDSFPFRLPRLRRGAARNEGRPIFKGKK